MPYADNQGARIHYKIEGKGSLLVIQHGFPVAATLVHTWIRRGSQRRFSSHLDRRPWTLSSDSQRPSARDGKLRRRGKGARWLTAPIWRIIVRICICGVCAVEILF